MRRRLLLGLKVSVSVALVAYVIGSIAQRDGIEVLSARVGLLDLGLVGTSIALHFVAIGAGVVRYRELLKRRAIRVPFAWLARTYLVGRFVGAFTPSTVGLDLYRSIAVARRTDKGAESAAAIFAEKLFGLLGLALVTLSLVGLGAGALLGGAALPMALAILACGVAGLYVLGRPSAMKRAASFLPGRVSRRLDPLLDAVGGGERSAMGALGVLGLSVAGHLSTAAVFVATALALRLDVDVATLLVVGNAIVIATLLPISIGGVGVREGVAVVLLATVGVGPTDASLVALLGYLGGQVPALVGGAIQLTQSAENTAILSVDPT
jgi:hypothetical protein